MRCSPGDERTIREDPDSRNRSKRLLRLPYGTRAGFRFCNQRISPMLEFFSDLFDTSAFPPRWHCGSWTPALGWLHILSDLGVWSAYLAIPFILVFFILRKKDLPFRSIFVLFGAFILACGTTHLMEAIIFWWPAYRLAGVIKLATALVSWACVIALIPVTPIALAMRSPEALENEIIRRK